MALTQAERSRLWRARHPETVKARNAARRAGYTEEQRQEQRDYQKAWAKRNQPALTVYQATRRARLRNGGDLTPVEWLAILEEFDNACAYCQTREGVLQMEHLTPLSRGGRNTHANVVPACGSCNCRKGTRTLLQFAGVEW